jgi:low affinity Fe/Cu permease
LIQNHGAREQDILLHHRRAAGLGVTFFERHVTRVVAAVVLLLLIVTVLQNTIFADFTTPLTGPARLHAGHLAIHLGVMMIAVLVPAFRRRLIDFGTTSLVTAAYGTVVVVSTLINVEPMTKVRVIQSLLVPATILSLGIALPAILENRIAFGQELTRTLDREAQILEQLAHVARMVIDLILLLEHPGYHG